MQPPRRFKLERRLGLGNAYEVESSGGLKRVLAEPDWTSIPDRVREAEQLGYDTLLAAEIPIDPYLPLALASQVPSRLVLGTGIAVALARSPVSTAYTAWELQRMSDGRFLLGLGSQVKAHVVRRFSMPWSAPAQRMREYIQVVRACWRNWQTGAPFSFQGECYRVDLMPPLMCLPPQAHPDIPIQLAAVGKRMLQVAGEVADGVRLHDFCSRRYVEEVALPNLRTGFRRSGRPEGAWARFDIAGGGMIVTAASAAELATEVLKVRKRLAFYASTPAYRTQMQIEGFGEQAEKLSWLSRRGRWDAMVDAFTEEMVRPFAVIGTHDVIVQQIRARFDFASAVQFSPPVRNSAEFGVLRDLMQDLTI